MRITAAQLGPALSLQPAAVPAAQGRRSSAARPPTICQNVSTFDSQRWFNPARHTSKQDSAAPDGECRSYSRRPGAGWKAENTLESPARDRQGRVHAEKAVKSKTESLGSFANASSVHLSLPLH